MLSDSHRNCDLLADEMVAEINRLEKVIKTYREMFLSMKFAPDLLDKIEEDAYNGQ